MSVVPEALPDARPDVTDYPYRWHWRAKHGDRVGQPCRVWARGRMNSVGVEFADGYRTVTAAYAVRRRGEPIPAA
jgi:hypothetical protein